ncbi:MAG: dethiobiotin synthase [Solirubrobacteraceae bacterium]|nr:dethiobiotin synthase [Solirubrobacteraceae bacterium]
MHDPAPVHGRGLFVTATDTEVGKTFLAGAIIAALKARGEHVAPFKPVVTGIDEPVPDHPADHELLAAAAGADPERVTPYRFGPAVSPHLAAEEHGVVVDPSVLVVAARNLGAGADALIVEGVGGLLVPLRDTVLVRDLAVMLGLPLIIAARPGLGTINHTLLTLEAARAVGLEVVAVVLTPWPEHPTAMQRSNLETIAAIGEVDVVTLARAEHATPAALARVGELLPLDRWLP